MKSLGRQRGGGNFNLKGKRTHLCSCKCCMMINPKQKILEREHKKEIQNFKFGDF